MSCSEQGGRTVLNDDGSEGSSQSEGASKEGAYRQEEEGQEEEGLDAHRRCSVIHSYQGRAAKGGAVEKGQKVMQYGVFVRITSGIAFSDHV